MRLYLETETETESLFSFDPEQTAESVAAQTLRMLECPYDVQISMLLTDEASIRELNRDSRGIDSVTDVLSFPMISWDLPCIWDDKFLKGQGAFYPGSGELMLGDIVICIPRLLEQAAAYGHSRQREFAFLTAHSMLHLCGYDHITPDGAAQMEEMQERILSSLGITRDLTD